MLLSIRAAFAGTSSDPVDYNEHQLNLNIIPSRSRDRHLSPHPFLPSWGSNTCTNDRPLEPWETGKGDLQTCCREHFNWIFDKCMSAGESILKDIPTAPPESWFYPIWSDVQCIVDTGDAPQYMRDDPSANMFPSFRKCCETNFKLELEECIENSAPLAPPTRPPIHDMSVVDISYEEYFYPSYTQNKCIFNANNAPTSMKNDPMTYFSKEAEECCKIHFPSITLVCEASSDTAPAPSQPDIPTYSDEEKFAKHYYPKFDLLKCVNDNDAPESFKKFPDSFFSEEVVDCCAINFGLEYATCLALSEPPGEGDGDILLLDSPLEQQQDDPSIDLDQPAILIHFTGRLYFQNVFLPTSSASNMATIRDTVVDTIRSFLIKSWPLIEVEARSFDGLDLTDLRRSLMDTELVSAEPNVFKEIDTSSRNLDRMQVFTFDAVITVSCDRTCASDINSAGRDEAYYISSSFDELVQNGSFLQTLKGYMEVLGMVGPFFSANLEEGQLMFHKSEVDLSRMTWSPTFRPTSSPTSTPTLSPTSTPTKSPTSIPSLNPTAAPSAFPTKLPTQSPLKPPPNKFYPNYTIGTCFADGQHAEFEFNFYDSLQDCCKFPWIKDFDICMTLGGGSTTRPTRAPTSAPTMKPSNQPTKYPAMPPTSSPTLGPTRGPTMKPTSSHKPTTSPTSDPTSSPTPNPTPSPTADPASENESSFLTPLIEDFESGLSSKSFVFVTDPENSWVIDDTVAYSGQFSMKNAPVTGGYSSKLFLRLDTPTSGVLHYHIRHDVFMPWDYVDIKLEDTVVMSFKGHAGPPSWSLEIIPLEIGSNVISWEVISTDPAKYSVSSNRMGEGLVWIDDVIFYPEIRFDFESISTFDMGGFQFFGTGTWGIDDSQPSDGDGLAAHSPKFLLPGEYSIMSADITVPFPGGEVGFDYIMGLGSFSFFINGMKRLDLNTPKSSSLHFKMPLSPGESTLEWRYDAPLVPNLPLSMVWIDNIQVVAFRP